MMNRKLNSFFMIFILIASSLASFVGASAANSGFAGKTNDYNNPTNTWQSSQPNFDNYYSGSMDTYWPILTQLQNDQCNATSSDFIIAIPPHGCEPTVVRSDLLAEQNTPVLCQLSAIRVNPLIDVSTIKSISFKGDYPDEIAGISFHPARAAIKTQNTLLGSPVEENIGYVVIVLKRQPDERKLEKNVSGMLTATINYDANGAFGTGAGEYYLKPIGEGDWKKDSAYSSFWKGKGYLRAINVGDNEASIQVMTSKDDVYRTVTLKEGETSDSIYYPGYYCTAALKLRLNKIDNSADMAKLNIDGDVFWVRKGSRILDGMCSVSDLNVFPGGTGQIELSCSGNNKFVLSLGDGGVYLYDNTNARTRVLIGGEITGTNNKRYLGYYGNFREDEKDKKFAVLFEKKLSEDEVTEITTSFEGEPLGTKKEIIAALGKVNDELGLKGKVLFSGGDGVDGIGFVSESDASSGVYSTDTNIPKYLEKMEKAALDLTGNFPAEKNLDDEYWGEQALFVAINAAGTARDENRQIKLINEFLKKYPGSKNYEYFRDLKLRLENFDYQDASRDVVINNDNYNILVDGFVVGTSDKDRVNIRVDGGSIWGELKVGEVYNMKTREPVPKDKKSDSKIDTLKVTAIDGSGATFQYVQYDEKGKEEKKIFDVGVGEYKRVGGTEFYVDSVNVEEAAYVSLIPEVKNTKTEANFTFNIGIEKRALELSPKAAQKKIDNLNKSIDKWNDKVEKLGNVIKVMKGSCLAVSSVLMFKNLITGFSNAASLARGDVMDKYKEKCSQDTDGSSVAMQKCYSKYSGDISKAIDAYGAGMTAVNERVSKCNDENAGVTKGMFSSDVVDGAKYENCIKTNTKKGDNWDVKDGDDGIDVKGSALTSVEDYKKVMLYQEVCGANSNSDACEIAKEDLKGLQKRQEAIEKSNELEKESKSEYGIVIPGPVNSNPTAKLQPAVSAKGVTGLDGVDSGNYLTQVQNGNDVYVAELNKNGEIVRLYQKGEGSLVYPVTPLTDSNNAKNQKKIDNAKTLVANIANNYQFYIPASGSSCEHKMKNPYVKYYEKHNERVGAAVVPFDTVHGWYAYVESGNDYTDAGAVKSFYVCNVGSDGEISDGPKGGDYCARSTTATSGTHFTPCLKMSSSDVTALFSKAEAAINEANRNGNGLSVDGKFIRSSTPLSAESLGADCTKFMSVQDCNTMFNVCDPVICPSSRCDMGGKWPVADVISTGIIGSIALCLPNLGNPSEGGVLIPVCLSGVHAGLDAYVSILKSERDCLEKSLKDGEYVGVCDEMTAVYTCEFFWGQISPVFDVLMTRLVENVYGGGGPKGGAEYLSISAAFENLDKSLKYFSSNYAAGAFRAFEMKNTEEIGNTICKGFVGSSVPTSADALDSLLEPESPTQFYAHFSDEVYTDATVPSTSHYKVYYHIFAGNDAGVNYKIYLKNPPQTSYYASTPTVVVKTGYIAKGETADEDKDFTAPSGYKELCVNINGEDNCGFESVTSNFALNYASQKYVADQANDRGITTTDDCVTTSASGWGMAEPNLQSGVESSIGQENIETSGIVRICASENPEQGVMGGNDVYCDPDSNDNKGNNPRCASGNTCEKMGGDVSATNMGVCKDTGGNNEVSTGKWVDVGYCDVENVRCWLDSSSVKKNLGQYLAVNNLTVDELVRGSKELGEVKEQYKSTKKELNGLKVRILEISCEKNDVGKEVAEIVAALDAIAGVEDDSTGKGTNANKAEALELKVELYSLLINCAVKKNEPKVEAVGVARSVDVEPKVDKSKSKTVPVVESRDEGVFTAVAKEEGCEDYAGFIFNSAKEKNVDPLLVLAVIMQESGCKKDASDGESFGLMGLTAGTAEDVCGVNRGDFNGIKVNPEKNIDCGVKILAKKHEDYGDGVEKSWAWTTKAGDGGFGDVVRGCIKDTSNGYSRYTGWDAALRGYNGWGCDDSYNTRYVKDVDDKLSVLEGRYKAEEQKKSSGADGVSNLDGNVAGIIGSGDSYSIAVSTCPSNSLTTAAVVNPFDGAGPTCSTYEVNIVKSGSSGVYDVKVDDDLLGQIDIRSGAYEVNKKDDKIEKVFDDIGTSERDFVKNFVEYVKRDIDTLDRCDAGLEVGDGEIVVSGSDVEGWKWDGKLVEKDGSYLGILKIGECLYGARVDDNFGLSILADADGYASVRVKRLLFFSYPVVVKADADGKYFDNLNIAGKVAVGSEIEGTGTTVAGLIEKIREIFNPTPKQGKTSVIAVRG